MTTTRGAAVTVVWYRRDLRLHDHPALAAAAGRGRIAPLFVLDPGLLRGRFASPNRTWFLLGALEGLAASLAARGVALTVRVGRPVEVVPSFASTVGADAVVVSRDQTPFGRRRDQAVASALSRDGIAFHEHPGVLIHDPEAVSRDDGGPFAVFTPFLRRWEAIPLRDLVPVPARLRPAIDGARPPVTVDGLLRLPEVSALALGPPTGEIARMPRPGEAAARARLEQWLASGPDHGPAAYARTRDRLDDPCATSRLGPDLRFGLVSPVEVATLALAADGASTGSRRFVTELAWRDFYSHVLWHEPRVAREPFQRRYAGAQWPGGSLDGREAPGDPGHQEAWRSGLTGYPIVDAAMRQLLATGFMPNRARMIVASFLTKDLLADWRVGEAHFMRHLLDGDPASNLGGWQWAASVGTDAQPYFRVFNPTTQAKRFDPDGVYVRRWVPEVAYVAGARIHAPWTMTDDEQVTAVCRIGSDYPAPVVDHAEARARALAWFRHAAGR